MLLKQPDAARPGEPAGSINEPPGDPKPKGAYSSWAVIEASAFQDLIEVLPDIIKAAAGLPLEFRLNVSLGDNKEVSAETVEIINKLLEQVNPDLCLKP